MLEWVLSELDNRRNVSDLALTIQKGLGRALAQATLNFVDSCRTVMITGGAAVNTYIVRGVREVLRKEGVNVVLQRKLPPGDGSIAVGQILVGAAKLDLLKRNKNIEIK